MSLRGDALLTWRAGGLSSVREAVLARTVHRVYRRLRFLVLEHSLSAEPPEGAPAGVELRPLDEAELGKLDGRLPDPTIERFRRRLARGRGAILAWRGERPIGWGWVSETVDPAVEPFPLPLPEDAVYCWDLYVDPSERGNGLGSALAKARLALAHEQGFARAWRLVAPDNLASLRTAAKSDPDVRVLGRGTAVRVLGKYRARYTLAGSSLPKDRHGENHLRGWLKRLMATVGERFLMPVQISPRAALWRSVYAFLYLPLVLMPKSRRYRFRHEAEELQVVLVGRENRLRSFQRRLFGAEPQVDSSTRVWPLSLPRSFRGVEADLVAVEVHPWLAGAFRREGWLIHPEFVRWEGLLDAMPPAKPSKSLRTDLLRVARGAYNLEDTAGSPADWREFRDGMVVPYARRRFGDDAWVASTGLFRALRRRGQLLFVREGQQRMAGACLVCRDDVAWLPVLGVAGGDLGRMRTGAIGAIYALTIERAKAAGMRRIDLGRTSAFASDGVARYKRKWGACPVPDPLSPLVAVRVNGTRQAVRDALEQEPFFVCAGGAVRLFPS